MPKCSFVGLQKIYVGLHTSLKSWSSRRSEREGETALGSVPGRRRRLPLENTQQMQNVFTFWYLTLFTL